uniref:ANK_REP_REGION domain-containing protein n=1 Tax=Steinernema glaseri TaxID=37863 RepID=A0A1I8A3N3_9BILA
MEDPDELITSAVLIACEEGNLAALKELATVHRMNLDVVNRLGETAVHVSAGAGHPQIVMFLHSRGCPISTADSRGDTPLFWAARNGHGHVIRYLCQDPDQVSINGINKSEETALHVATRYSQTDAALALLEAGANIDLQDEHGETALHIASWHGYAGLLHVLCKFEPNMTLRNQPKEREKRIETVALPYGASTTSIRTFDLFLLSQVWQDVQKVIKYSCPLQTIPGSRTFFEAGEWSTPAVVISVDTVSLAIRTRRYREDEDVSLCIVADSLC